MSAIIRPVPEDPIEAFRGAYATPGPATGAARASDRADLALLSHAGLTIQAVTYELGMQAGRIRAQHHQRERADPDLRRRFLR